MWADGLCMPHSKLIFKHIFKTYFMQIKYSSTKQMDMILYTAGKATNHSRSNKWPQNIPVKAEETDGSALTALAEDPGSTPFTTTCNSSFRMPWSSCTSRLDVIVGWVSSFTSTFYLVGKKKRALIDSDHVLCVRVCLPSAEVQADTMPALHGFWESKLKHLCSCSGHFHDWVFSPAFC